MAAAQNWLCAWAARYEVAWAVVGRGPRPLVSGALSLELMLSVWLRGALVCAAFTPCAHSGRLPSLQGTGAGLWVTFENLWHYLWQTPGPASGPALPGATRRPDCSLSGGKTWGQGKACT